METALVHIKTFSRAAAVQSGARIWTARGFHCSVPYNREGNKRCRNHLLRRSGLSLEAPHYRAGYSLLLNER